MSNEPAYDAEAFRRFEQEGWADVAETYAATFGQVTGQAIGPLLDAVQAAPGSRLLDIACGAGALTAAAAGRGAEAVGVDFVPNMLALAARLHPGIDFRPGDAEALTFGGGSFDAVVCSFGILHFPRPGPAIAEAFRVLTSGGRYALTAWCPGGPDNARGLVEAAVRAHGTLDVGLPEVPPVSRFGSAEACREVFEEAGFAEFETQELPIVYRLARAEELIDNLIKGTVRNRELLVRQAPEQLARIREAVVEHAAPFAVAGGFEIPNPALLAMGRKP